jgi:uncharacterized damage-inducible protein DinB
MTPDDLQQLHRFNAWANRRILDAAQTLTASQFTQTVTSSFPSVRDTLAHIYGAEHIWLERFQGRSPAELPGAAEFPDLAVLRAAWEPHEQALIAFVGGLSQADLDGDFEYKTFKFGVLRNPLWQSVVHVVNHGTYHRGQITTLLRQFGVPTVSTDLIYFYRESAAAQRV